MHVQKRKNSAPVYKKGHLGLENSLVYNEEVSVLQSLLSTRLAYLYRNNS